MTRIVYALLACLLVPVVHGQSGPNTYVNPVIPGDHPDPTLTRVGEYYYTSGSSFNVTPRIYRSTDLVHWEVVSQPVAPTWSEYGDTPGGGVWGGHLVQYNGLFWHFFGRGGGAMYYVTSNRPEGPWGTPIQMSVPPGVPALGVDNSIFIDDDNRWFLLTKAGESNNHLVELGANGQPNGNVLDLTWLNPEEAGRPYGWAEGPVMWKHDGYYYYSFAQHLQGTQYVMRSDTLSDDPADWDTPREFFESVPDRNQRAFRSPNHSSPAVTTDDGRSWVISQAYDQSGAGEEWKALGRQGVLSEIVYEEGWPVARFPSNEAVEGPDLPSGGVPWHVPRSDMFNNGAQIGLEWSFLGTTPDASYSTSERPGWLRLYPTGARRVPATLGQNTLIQNDAEHAYALITRVDFDPASATDEAGLWIFNGLETLQAKLFVGLDEVDGRAVSFRFDGTAHSVALTQEGPVWLKIVRNGHVLTGYFSHDGAAWTAVGDAINVASMDGPQPDFNAFTGNQQGPYVIGDQPADYDLYIYRDAYTRIPAQYPANFNGVLRRAAYLGGIQDGDWAMYAGVEFGSVPDAQDDVDYPRTPTQLMVEAASATGGGAIEVWIDDPETGQKIGEIVIADTGNWTTYETFSGEVAPVSGQHDVFLKMKGAAGTELFRLRALTFADSSTGTSAPDEPARGGYSLGQNYPNPYGAEATTIAFTLPAPAHARLTVYNLLGQKVATPLDELRPAGTSTVVFDGRGLSSGTYFYRLSAGSYTATRTMTLTR